MLVFFVVCSSFFVSGERGWLGGSGCGGGGGGRGKGGGEMFLLRTVSNK